MEGKTKHTPGPWVVDDSATGTNVLLSQYDRHLGTPVRIARCDDYWVGIDEARANARLIKAAPDLLAACEAVISAGESENLPIAVYDAIEAAIAKAEGELT